MYQVDVPHKEDSLGGSPPDRMKPRSVKQYLRFVEVSICLEVRHKGNPTYKVRVGYSSPLLLKA